MTTIKILVDNKEIESIDLYDENHKAETAENKRDLISRQAVLDIWHTSYSDIRVEDEEIKYKKIAFELPSADARPNIHGHWINETPHTDGCSIYTCSECGRSNLWESPFCPSCGADMREPIGEKGTE